ncbi:nucleotidyltransferase domain-containing protein, partial [uncultured Dubosiella sp.]
MKENACFDTLVERLIGCDPVEAIGLGGSRATGKADIHSDYDLYVYVTEEMPLEIRKQLFDGLFRIMEYDNMFWEREDDGIFKDGIPIDILYRRIGDFDRTLEPVVTGHQPYNAYTTCMWNNLLNTKILFDRSGRLTQLKQKYDIPYPE